MKKSKKSNDSLSIVLLAVCALLAALSILFGKYLAINLGDSIRLSLENLPILLAGFLFGPAAGAVTGTVADLVGCLLVGYSINPLITLGAAVIGLTAGFAGKAKRLSRSFKVILAVAGAHLIGSVLIKTIGLTLFYGSPFLITLAWRALTYLLVGTIEIVCLWALSGNRSFLKQAARITKESHK
ncbi:MAG: folate family ECF transporter S component [Clostridia bacterium]|nr:folate family ECF transporter S component [Clostridia bacterium]